MLVVFATKKAIYFKIEEFLWQYKIVAEPSDSSMTAAFQSVMLEKSLKLSMLQSSDIVNTI